MQAHLCHQEDFDAEKVGIPQLWMEVLQVLMVQHEGWVCADVGAGDAAVAVGAGSFEPDVWLVHVTLVVRTPAMLVLDVRSACKGTRTAGRVAGPVRTQGTCCWCLAWRLGQWQLALLGPCSTTDWLREQVPAAEALT